ncbi:MAG: hypothetical protein ABEJ81_05415 [Haloferacaceae archaeon]
MTANEMVSNGYSKEAIRTEIGRCELLCANCHWREHHSSPAGTDLFDVTTDDVSTAPITGSDLPLPGETSLTKAERLRAWTYAYKGDRGCQRCGETDPIRLQFHHVTDDTRMGVGAMIAYSYPADDVLAEVERCIVLCANCHRVEHYRTPTTDGKSDRI